MTHRLSEKERDALKSYAARHGRTWKRHLLDARREGKLQSETLYALIPRVTPKQILALTAADLREENPGRKSARRANPGRKPAPANEYEADELRMHIDNTRRLYDMKRAVEMLLLRKAKAGKYNSALAPKAFLFVVTAGAKDYRREYGADDPRSFNPATRMMAAKDFTREFEGEMEFREASGRRKNPARRRPATKAARKPRKRGRK